MMEQVRADRIMLNRIESAKPNLALDELAEIATRVFGVTGDIKLLTSERDQNAAIADGTHAYVLKIGNAGDDPEVIRLQNAAMEIAARHEAKLPVPRVIRSKDGNDLEFVEHGGKRHTARLLVRLPGVAIGSLKRSRRLLRNVGAAAAHLDQALVVLAAPHVNEMPWDMHRASDMRGGLPHIAEKDQRRALEAVLDDAAAVTLPALAALPVQWIHNDFNLSNLLAEPETPDRLSGIVDFGDILQTARVVEIAIAATHLGAREPRQLEGTIEVIAGYHRIGALGGNEITLLPRLMALRAAMAVLGRVMHVAKAGIGHFDLKPIATYLRFIALFSSTGWEAIGERIGNGLETGENYEE